MPVIVVKDALHVRLKRLAIETGITLGQLVHQHLEESVTAAELALAGLKKRVKAAAPVTAGAKK